MRPREPDPLPPPRGRHKWMAPKHEIWAVAEPRIHQTLHSEPNNHHQHHHHRHHP